MIEKDTGNLIYQTKTFWDVNPCDGQRDIFSRMQFRYGKEPWLPPVLDEIATFHDILEVGCGQGTDAIYCCQRMPLGSNYIGIDLSENSIEQAKKAAEQVKQTLIVHPRFTVGNTESLEFDDQAFDCVVSIGVLHHTPNIDKSLAEIYRVLKPGGVTILILYRLFSPKLLGAYCIRTFSRCLDKLTFSQNLLLKVFQKIGSNHSFGTMFLECIGVPILRSYTKNTLKEKLSQYYNVEIRTVGVGVKIFDRLSMYWESIANLLGALYLIKAYKPLQPIVTHRHNTAVWRP
jgi:ubiquinone/menaquinone biosynthesis C-methylase UbiE